MDRFCSSSGNRNNHLIYSFPFSGAYVGSGSSATGILFVWDSTSGKLKKKLKAHEAGIHGFAWGEGGSSGQQVATIGRDGTLILWA